jgi:hypothetical protein
MTLEIKHFSSQPKGTRVAIVAVYIDLRSAMQGISEILTDITAAELSEKTVQEIENLGRLARAKFSAPPADGRAA